MLDPPLGRPHGKKTRIPGNGDARPNDEGGVRSIQYAFRIHLQRQRGLSERSAIRYVAAAGALLDFCEEHGHAIEQGQAPASVLVDFAAAHDDGRVWRGAVLFCEFLRERGVPLPVLDPLPGTLRIEQVERYLVAADGQPEPYATLLCLLPWSGLRAQDLLRLPREAVREAQDGSLCLVCEGVPVGLCARAQARLRGYLTGFRASFEEDSPLMFPGATGGSIAPSTITKRLRRCREQAELPEFRTTALSDVYLSHYFEPSPPSAGGGLGELPEDEDPASEPMSSAASAEAAADSPPSTPSDPNEERATVYDDDDDEPLDDDELDADADDPFEPDDAYEERDRHAESRRGRERDPGARRAARPRRSSGRARRGSGEGRRASRREVDGLLPKSGYIHIRYRDPERGARPKYCGRYLVREVAPDGSIEAFIFEQLAPHWGGGEYLIFTDTNELRPRAIVDIATPPPRPSGSPGPHGSPGVGAPEWAHGGPGYGESPFEAGYRLGRREAMRDPYAGAPPFGYDPGPAMGAALPTLPERSESPPSWWIEERKLQLDLQKEERQAQRDREEREERRREAELAAQRERDERELARRWGELERREQWVEERLKSTAAGPADPFEAAGALFDKAAGLTLKFQKIASGNDNGSKDRGPIFDLLEATAGRFASEAGMAVGNAVSGPRRPGPSRPAAMPPRASGAPRPKAKRPKAKRGAARRPSPPREAPLDPEEAEESSPVALPDRIPGYVKEPAQQLERVFAEEQSESAILERLIGMLAALGASPSWTPYVQAVLMHLMRDEMEQTLHGLGAILGALVRGGVLGEPAAHCVLGIAQERWDEAREAILVAYQQRQGAAE